MDPDQTFVSSCVISLGSKKSAQKPMTATSIPTANSTEKKHGAADCRQRLTQSQQKEFEWSDPVVDVTKSPSLPDVNAEMQTKANYAKMYCDAKLQQQYQDSCIVERYAASHHDGVSLQEVGRMMEQCSISRNKEESTSKISSTASFIDKSTSSMWQVNDSSQIACFDSMAIFHGESSSATQMEKHYSVTSDMVPFSSSQASQQEQSSYRTAKKGKKELKQVQSALCFDAAFGAVDCSQVESHANRVNGSTMHHQPLPLQNDEFVALNSVSYRGVSSSAKNIPHEAGGSKHLEACGDESPKYCENRDFVNSSYPAGFHSDSPMLPVGSLPSGNRKTIEQSSDNFEVCANTDSPNVISIFKGNVRLKSKAFESNTSVTKEAGNQEDLSTGWNGMSKSSAEALLFCYPEERHGSQVVGGDANEVDGHVRVKQSLFETLPVDALYEHGNMHSSQIVTRGRRKSNLGEVLNDFNTKPLGEINERAKDSPEKDIVDFDVTEAVTSFKTKQNSDVIFDKNDLHESQRVDYDIPFNNKLVKENSERFLHEDFCYKSEYQSSQNLTEEERLAASGLFTSIKGEFEKTPLDFIRFDERPQRHPSQIIKDQHMSKTTDEEALTLSEPHPSQQVNYDEEVFRGVSQVKDKRRQYYESCNSPARCESRELLEDAEILNAPELSGLVRQTASVYLEGKSSESHLERSTYPGSDVYVGHLRGKFESQSISQLIGSDALHSSQCVESPMGVSEEALLGTDSPENLSVHSSQVIDPSEYAAIKSDVVTKRKAFTLKTSENLHNCEQESIILDSDVKGIKNAFESCQTPPPLGLHPSQIVGHDIHLISNSESVESLNRTENSQLHESQKVNYGVIRPPSRQLDRIPPKRPPSQAEERSPGSRCENRSYSRSSMLKSPEADDKDLELLLNYTPVVKEELPSMVTVMVKGVPEELIKAGHPMLTEYVTDNKSGKRVFVGSGYHTPRRNISDSGNQEQQAGQGKDHHNKHMNSNVKGSRCESVSDFVKLPAVECSLPSYPDKPSAKNACNAADQPLPPPPPMFGSDPVIFRNGGFSEASHSDFLIGSSVHNPSSCNNMVSVSDAESAFTSIEQEQGKRERFKNKQMTSSAESCFSFLRVRDEELNRKISAATVESYPESDDQWDFVL